MMASRDQLINQLIKNSDTQLAEVKQNDDWTPEELESFLNFNSDEQVGGDFGAVISTLRNTDIDLEEKTKFFIGFNTKYHGKYKAMVLFDTEDEVDQNVSIILACAKTNKVFERFVGIVLSLSEAAKIKAQFSPEVNKKIPNAPLQLSTEGFFSRKNKCKAMLYASAAVGLAAAGCAYLTSRMNMK